MIVDLMRNDVSRVAEIGSVRVPALLSVEWFETGLQLTSDVTARLRPGTGWVELFRALFPCGSVTGAPKPSTMALIRESWNRPRAGCTAGPSAGLVRRMPRCGPGSTWPSAPPWSTGRPGRRSTAPAGASPTAPTRPPSTPRCCTRRPSSTRPPPAVRTAGDDAVPARSGACAIAIGICAGWRPRPSTSGSGSTCRTAPEALRHGRRRRTARVRLRLRRAGPVTVDVEPFPAPSAGPVRLALHPEPVDPYERWLYHKTRSGSPTSVAGWAGPTWTT